MKPLLYLDVDGVLNVISLQEDECEVTETPAGWGVRIPKGMSEKLKRLEAKYEIVWATAWRERAASDLAAALGVGTNWEHLQYWDMKLPEILKHAGGRSFTWIDDDADWELEENEAPANARCINVAWDVGLTEELVEELCK